MTKRLIQWHGPGTLVWIARHAAGGGQQAPEDCKRDTGAYAPALCGLPASPRPVAEGFLTRPPTKQLL